MFNYKDTLPQRLKYYRKKYGYTQEEIAKKLKMKQSSYANWEAGFRQPNIEKFFQIADIYETSADSLAGRTDI